MSNLEPPDSYEQLISVARPYLTDKNRELISALVPASESPQISASVSASGILLTSSAGLRIQARCEIIGEFFPTRSKWRWAWVDVFREPSTIGAALRVQEMGIKARIKEFVEPIIQALPQTVTDFTAAALFLSHADASWTVLVPGNVYVQLALSAIQFVPRAPESS